MRIILIKLFLMAFVCQTYTQDSVAIWILKHNESKIKPTSTDFDRAVKISKYFQYKNLDQSHYFAEEALSIAKQLNKKEELHLAHHLLAKSHSNQGNLKETVSFFQEALKIAKSYPEHLIDSGVIYNDLRNVAVSEMKLGHYGLAAEGLHQALQFYQDLNDTIQIASILNNLCVCQYEIDRYTEAISICKQCMELLIQIDDTITSVDYAYALANSGLSLSELGRHEEALDYFKRSKNLSVLRNDDYNLSYDYYYLGDAYNILGLIDSAIMMYSAGMEISKELNDEPGLEWGKTSLGILYITQNEYRKGVDILNNSLQYYKNFNLMELKTMYQYLGEGYKGLLIWDSAYAFVDSARVVSNKLNEIDYNDAVAVIQGKLDFAEQEKRIILNDALLAKANQKTASQRLFIWFIVIGLISVVVFLIFILTSLKRKRADNRLISEQKREVEKQRDFAEEQQKIAKLKSIELEEKHKNITDSIEYGKKIQDALLTSEAYWSSISKNYFILYQPKDVVSGDFHWAYQNQNECFIIVADCTGHGVPGAFMSMLGIGFLNEIILENHTTDPAQILDELRGKIIKALENEGSDVQQKDGMDICLCRWNKETNMLTYSGANNALWLIRNKGNQDNFNDIVKIVSKGELDLIEIPADPQPVGRFGNTLEPFTNQSIQLKSGDRIYAFSDGYYDQFGGPKGKKLKPRVMKELLLETFDQPMGEQKVALINKHEEWKGTFEQVDDICIVGIEI